MNIRLATIDDIPAITALVNASYRGETGAQGWTTESHLLGGIRIDDERVRELIEALDSVILLKISEAEKNVQTNDQKIEGCVHLEKKNETTAYLGMLTTSFRTQAKGIGSSLLSAAEDFARAQWKIKRIEMTVISVRTELIAWYVKRGYKLTNEKRPFPMGDPRFGIPKVDSLEFNVLEKDI